MRLGGRAIAMQLAVECGERFWSFKVGYDEAFTHFSPGILLYLHLVARSAALGLRSFELLGFPDEPHKQMWRPVERPCVTLRAYPYGPRGLVLLGSDAAWLALSRSTPDAARFFLALSRLRKLRRALRRRPLRWEWLRQWWRVYGPVYGGRGLRIVTVRRGGHLIGALPLYLHIGHRSPVWAHYLGFLSMGESRSEATRPEYLDLLHAPGEARACRDAMLPALSTPRWAGGTSWTCARSAGARLCSPGAIRRPGTSGSW